MKGRIVFILAFLLAAVGAGAQIHSLTFARMDASDGLNDNLVQHIMQLPDGRMAITTRGNINIFDGAEFRYIHADNEHVGALREYNGAYHVYVDMDERLWVKEWQKLRCFDLRHNRYVSNFDSLFRSVGVADEVTDLFIDSDKKMWVVTPRAVVNTTDGVSIARQAGDATLQDIETCGGKDYLFYSNGEVRCYDDDGHESYRSAAYGSDKASLTASTSLVVKSPDGTLYQLRNGSESVCLRFAPDSGEWTELLRTNDLLHTVIAPTDSDLYVTTNRNTLHINAVDGSVAEMPYINVKDSEPHTEGLNTIYQDRQGGVWLGTYDKGLLYAHPLRFRIKSYKNKYEGEDLPPSQSPFTDSRGWVWKRSFDGLVLTKPESGETRMLYTEDGLSSNSIHSIMEDRNGDIWVGTGYGINRIKPDLSIEAFTSQDGTLSGAYADNAAAVLPGGQLLFEGVDGYTVLHPDSVDYGEVELMPTLTGLSLNGERIPVGHTLLPEAEPFMREFEFSHDENNIRFDISSLNYALPEHTVMRYRIMSDHAQADTLWHTASVVNGLIDHRGVMHLSLLKAAPGEYTLQVKADGQTEPLALRFLITPPWWQTAWARSVFLLLLVGVLVAVFVVYTRITRLRIRQRHKEEILLMRIRNLIEREKLREENDNEVEEKPEEPEVPQEEAANDNDFVNRAIELVERNINTKGYSVEQLSRDLCMERTGLYKKMTTLLDKSPSLFIRSIRLQHAERLLIESNLSIADVAEQTGFSSASHMSKCFQEDRGCTPKQVRESRGRK